MRRGRPLKPRLINKEPKTKRFSPRGTAGRPGYITLCLDEYEAIRLSDLLGMSQIEAAKNMNISRGTYQRILKSAHSKIAEALDKNSAIELKGGNVEIKNPKTDNL